MKRLLAALFIVLIFTGSFFCQNSFTAAFDSIHKTLSTHYAFTDWKKINWNSLYNEFHPRVVSAEAANDSGAFIMALKEYTFRIPDGHVGFGTGFHSGVKSDLLPRKNTNWVRLEEKLREQQIGGSFGFALIKLDDGRFVVKLVTAGSPADQAGIKFGAEILEVNNKPIEQVIDSVKVLWAEQIPATKETKQLMQCRFIGRAPVNTNMKIKFKNRGEAAAEKNIIAVYDNYLTYELTSMFPIKSPEISYRILDGGYGYLQITSCIPPVSVVSDFMNSFMLLLGENIKGLVVDLRINSGGQDFFAAAVAGCFYTDTTHYEYWSFYDEKTKTFQITDEILDHFSFQKFSTFKPEQYPRGSIYIEPQGLNYSGPVVVLVSPRNVSSGEGIAMALSKLPQCKVVGFYGSHGSFGITAPGLPLLSEQDSLELSYPMGRSLDINNNIQVDSDSNMVGGVIPDVRPPLNDETIDKVYLQGIDVELEYAIQELDKLVSVEDKTAMLPQVPVLYQNYPNPFNQLSNFEFRITDFGLVSLKVFDILGNEIIALINEEKQPGKYIVKFDGSNLASGVYFYQLKCGNFIDTKKFILLK